MRRDKEKELSECSKSAAMRRLTAIFESEGDYRQADVWKEFFLSEDFLREQNSEEFVRNLVQYLSDWQRRKRADRSEKIPILAFITKILHDIADAVDRFIGRLRRDRPDGDNVRNERSLPAEFLTELAIAYALKPEQGQDLEEVSKTFPARKVIVDRWNIEMAEMANPLVSMLNRPDCVVRMRSFYDYLQLRRMNTGNDIRPANKMTWSKILQYGQPSCLYELNTGERYLFEGYRGECLIGLFTSWIRNERVPKCALECMYQEYNLKYIGQSGYRKLYEPLKQEILRQYPDIEGELYDTGARAQKLAGCFRELAKIVSDHHSNYDKGIYEETQEIRKRIQTFLAGPGWLEFQYDLELFDKIFSQFEGRHVMPGTLSEGLIALYTQKGQWEAEDRARQLVVNGLIPSFGFSRRIREIEGLTAAQERTAVEEIGNSPDFWQYYLTWGFGLRKVCAEDIRPERYKRDERRYLPAYMEYTYYPSSEWQKCFAGFDEAAGEIVSPVSAEWLLPDQRTLKAEFHLHYVLYWIDGQPVYGAAYTFDDLVRFSASLEKPELFFFLLAVTSIDGSVYDRAVSVAREWLRKIPVYPQTIPDIARLLVERCCGRQAESSISYAVYYMEQEQLCVRAVVMKEEVVFYALRDFAWQEFHKMTVAGDVRGEQTRQAVMAFLQRLRQPLPVSLGAVSLEGMEPGVKAEHIIEALGQHENRSGAMTETYCVLRYGVQRKGARVLYCAMNPFGTDLTQRNEQMAGHYAFSYQELDKKVKEKHRIAGFLGWGDCYTPKEIYEPKLFAIGESGTYYYYQAFRMRRGDSLAAILPDMFDLRNVTEVECYQGHLSISRIDGHLEYCYGEREIGESVHSLEKTGADFLSVLTETELLRQLLSWLDRLIAAHKTELQWIHIAVRAQADGSCVVDVMNRTKGDDADTFAEEQLSDGEAFVWKHAQGGADVFKRIKNMLAWYLENGSCSCQLKSARRIDIAYWIEEKQVMEETVLIETESGSGL